jgi:hypothetical protein
MKAAARIAFAISWAAMAISHALGLRLVRDEIRSWTLDSELSGSYAVSIDHPDEGSTT